MMPAGTEEQPPATHVDTDPPPAEHVVLATLKPGDPPFEARVASGCYITVREVAMPAE